MSHSSVPALGPTQVACGHVRAWRAEAGYRSQRALADRLTELGVPTNRDAVANIENGRRDRLTIEELFALAVALDVSPTDLLVPDDDNAMMTATGTGADSALMVRAWIEGALRLPSHDVDVDTEAHFFRKAPARVRTRNEPWYYQNPLIGHIQVLEAHVRTWLAKSLGIAVSNEILRKTLAPAIRAEGEKVKELADTMAGEIEDTIRPGKGQP